jgi:coenzyme F420-reducing hydrogenase beta subunit
VSTIYAAARKDKSKIKKSASGGVFACFAEYTLDKGGVVFGACIDFEEGKPSVKHIEVTDINSLDRILGSKYIQSNITNVFKPIKEYLMAGKNVIFSGTPCQIDALKAYLNKEYENLILIDIVCHGIAGQKMFADYIKCLEEKYQCKAVDFVFRNKDLGWGHTGFKFIGKDKAGNVFEQDIPYNESSYYKMFLSSQILRENCYSCKYSRRERVSDITLGDFWGVSEFQPEILAENGGKLERSKGISIVLINTAKGKRLFEKCSDLMDYYTTTYEKIAQYNPSIRVPSKQAPYRDKILSTYEKSGYRAAEREFMVIQYSEKVKNKLKCIIKNLGGK